MKINVPVNPTYKEILNDKAKKWEELKTQKYQEYRSKWLNNPRNFILEDAPLHLDIEPTNLCNLKCPMCSRTVLLNNKNTKNDFKLGYMDYELYKKIIDEAVDIGVYSIKLNWLGEPLMHPNIVDMVRYAKQKGIIDVMLNTNGVLLNEDMVLGLIDAGLDKIFFSFDSPNKDNYEEIRVGAKYEEVLSNIKKLNEIKNKYEGINPLTRVSMVLMEDNKSDLNKYINLFEDIVDVVAYVEYRTPVGEDDNCNTKFNFACSQLWQRMFISWDGEVIVCCVDSKREYVVGNVNNENIKSIWKNDKYNHIRKQHEQGEYNKITICKKCDLPQKTEDGNV